MSRREARADTELHETHVSVVFLMGDRAYKLKKPVRLDFVDLSSREARERLCHREVELNRRIAPDVYLGVAEVRGPDGEACDHLVVMRRMPADRRLSALVRSGQVSDDELSEIARVVAAFHARAETSPRIAADGAPGVVARRWEDMFATMEPFTDRVVPADAEARVRHLARRYLSGRDALLESRVEQGKVRDGHGDLLADDVYCLDDGPRILDCVEFDDHLRHVDVLSDVCFLAMDLERLGAPHLASAFLRRYRELAGEHAPETLSQHYLAYRAHIRAMVACLRAAQGGDPDAEAQACALLEIAREHLERGQVALTLVGGLPGVGKSTLAAGLADRFDWSTLRSDEVRKDLAGVPHTERSPEPYRQGLYGDEVIAATYREMLERARVLLERGEPVVLDASWLDERHRQAAVAVARDTHSELIELRCVAPVEIATARLRGRGVDASDATPGVAAAMAGNADPWPTAHAVDTSVEVEIALDRAVSTVDERLRNT